MPRTVQKNARKQKRSYTLSPGAVTLLAELRRERRAASISSVLEEILDAIQLDRQKRCVEQAVSDYYSSLSEEERREQTSWGQFALKQFSDEVA